MNNVITLETIVMITGFAITILTFIKTQKKDLNEEIKERTKMYQKIDLTCTQINEILRSVDRMTDRFELINETQARHEEQLKTAFKTFELHESRIRYLEKVCQSINHSGEYKGE